MGSHLIRSGAFPTRDVSNLHKSQFIESERANVWYFLRKQSQARNILDRFYKDEQAV